MKEYSIVEEFALIALDGLDSRHSTEMKKAALMGIEMARGLREILWEEAEMDTSAFVLALEQKIKSVKHMKNKDFREVEKAIADVLTAEGVLTEIPSLLGCDLDYYTAEITMREYKSDEQLYLRIVESIRADILEPGEVNLETVCFLWLLRECGCMHDIFSQEEQRLVEQRLVELKGQEECYRILLEQEFHNAVRNTYIGWLKWKHNLFKNPYLEGVNLLFPFFDRRQAIFIDMVILGTSVFDRRQAAMDFLKENGHSCVEMKIGGETLLKVDNHYYRIWPSTRIAYNIPIQGVELSPVYK